MNQGEDRADRAAQQWLDELGAERALTSGKVDPEDDLALYALVYSALREDDGPAPAAPAAGIEASIRRIEAGGMHPLEIVLAGIAVVLALLIASPALATVAEHLRGVLDGPHRSASLAAAAAVFLLVGIERIVGVMRLKRARAR